MLIPNTNRIFASLLKNKANEGELVAQQVEHIPFKDGVLGSSPNWLTKAVKSFLAAFFMVIGAFHRDETLLHEQKKSLNPHTLSLSPLEFLFKFRKSRRDGLL